MKKYPIYKIWEKVIIWNNFVTCSAIRSWWEWLNESYLFSDWTIYWTFSWASNPKIEKYTEHFKDFFEIK